jgi:hypothetical protein
VISRHADAPQPGYFSTRLVKGGPLVCARIWRPCACTVGGGDGNVPHDWTPACDRWQDLVAEIDGHGCPVDAVWQYAGFIDKSDYEFMRDAAAWDRLNDPDSPHANPRQAVDLRQMKPIGP